MTGILKVDQIQNNTGTAAITVDSGGGIRPLNTPIFWVWRSQNYVLTNGHTNMIYDKVDIDNRSAYNNSTGIYTIPVAGIYEFGWAAIGSNENTTYRYSLARGGNRDTIVPGGDVGRVELRVDTVETGASSVEYGTNGEFCYYLECAVGDQISVQGSRDDGASTNIYGDVNYRYTYFRGKLVA